MKKEIENISITELYSYYQLCEIMIQVSDNMIRSVEGGYPDDMTKIREEYTTEKGKYVTKRQIIIEEIKRRLEVL